MLRRYAVMGISAILLSVPLAWILGLPLAGMLIATGLTEAILGTVLLLVWRAGTLRHQ